MMHPIKAVFLFFIGSLFVESVFAEETQPKIADLNGSPAWYFDGKPVFLDAISSDGAFMLEPKYSPAVEAFGKAGIHVYSPYLGMNFPGNDADYTNGKPEITDWWTGPNQYDFTQVDRLYHHLIKTDPQARFIVRIEIFCQIQWWYDAHLAERAMALKLPGTGVIDGYATISFASKLFRKECAESLRQLVHHVEASDYANRIMGYHLTGGRNAEWIHWAYDGNYVKPELGDLLSDFNPMFIAEYQDWLRQKYTTVENLRAAWRKKDVTFESATLAGEERWVFSLGSLRDPAKDQMGIDTIEFIWWIMGDFAEMSCRTVKEASRYKDIPCGIFTGFMYSLNFARALESPYINFFLSPPGYEDRGLGGTSTVETFTLSSIAHRKKFYILESDIRTVLKPFKLDDGEVGRSLSNMQDTLMVLRREFAEAICNNHGIMWLHFNLPVYHAPEIMQDFNQMRAVGESSLKGDRQSTAEIAVIASHRSRNYQKWSFECFGELNRIGAPFDAYLMEDFEQIPTDRYKLFVFISDGFLDSAQRRWIESLKSRGHWLMFHYATGLFENWNLSTEAMSQVIGMKVKLDSSGHVSAFDIRPNAPTIFQGLPAHFNGSQPVSSGSPWGPLLKEPDTTSSFDLTGECTPSITVDDLATTKIGVDQQTDATLFAFRKFKDWTSVYYGYPTPHPTIVRSVARAAGVHIYNDADDAFYANRGFIGIHAKQGGKKTIALPSSMKVFDVFNKKWISQGSTSYTIDLPKGTTSLVAIGEQADLCEKALQP